MAKVVVAAIDLGKGSVGRVTCRPAFVGGGGGPWLSNPSGNVGICRLGGSEPAPRPSPIAFPLNSPPAEVDEAVLVGWFGNCEKQVWSLTQLYCVSFS